MLLKSHKHLLILFIFIETVIASEEVNDVVNSKQNLNLQGGIENLNIENSSKQKLNLENSEHEQLNGKESSFEKSSKEPPNLDGNSEEPLNKDDYSEENIKQSTNEKKHSGEEDVIKIIKSRANDEPGFNLTPTEIEKFKIWRNGVIPYYIDVISFSEKVTRDSIRSQLQSLNGMTSINFVELQSPPSDEDTRWVFFMNRRGLLGCADHVVRDFTNKGVQKVVLGYNCMVSNGEVAEAVMSIVGIPAQHNDPQRDKYISVKTENIMPDKIHLFDKLKNSDWLFHDLEYDFNSITHYDYNKYSVNGHATIVPKDPSQQLNPGVTFSSTDILKINMLYNFITRNKKIEASQCKKLFKPGHKFRHPGNIKPIPPRKKASLYLGHTDNEAQDESEAPEVNKDVDQNYDTKEKVEDNNQQSIQMQSDNDDNRPRGGLKMTKNYKINALSYLSDYQTDDNRNRKKYLQHVQDDTDGHHDMQQLKFGKPGNG